MIDVLRKNFETLTIAFISISVSFIAISLPVSPTEKYLLTMIVNFLYILTSSIFFKNSNFNFYNPKNLILLVIIFFIFFLFNSFEFYLNKIPGQYWIFFIILLTTIIIVSDKYYYFLYNKYITKLSIILFLCVLFFIFTVYAIDIDHPYMANNLNYGVVVMPIINLMNGSDIPIINQSQYGLYPYFLKFYFQFVSFNFYNINLFFAAIFIISLSILFFILVKISKNVFISLIALLSSICLLTVFGNVWPGELYFQFTPIRIFIPCVAILLYYFFLKGNLNYYSFVTLLCVCFFWNFDTSIAVYLCCFISLIINKNIRFFSIKNLFFIFAPFLFFIFFQIYLKFSTGIFFSIYDLFEPLFTFKNHSDFNTNNLPLLFILIINLYFFMYFYFNNKNIRNRLGLFISLLNLFILPYGFRSPAPLALCSFLIPINFLFVLINNNYIIYSQKNNIRFLYNFVSISPYFLLLFIFVFDLNNNNAFKFINIPFYEDNYQYYVPDNDISFTISASKFDLIERNINPIWINKINTINYFLNNNIISTSDNIFVASERDHFFYYYLKTNTPHKLVNWLHVSEYDHWGSIRKKINDKKFEFIITDSSFLYEHAGKGGKDGSYNFELFYRVLQENYEKIIELHDGYEWYYPGYQKSLTTLYKRK